MARSDVERPTELQPRVTSEAPNRSTRGALSRDNLSCKSNDSAGTIFVFASTGNAVAKTSFLVHLIAHPRHMCVRKLLVLNAEIVIHFGTLRAHYTKQARR